VVAQSLAPGSPISPFVPVLTDPRNTDIWEQLPDEYQRLMLESGEALIAQPNPPALGGRWCGQARRLSQQRLTLLPRASLQWYRQRVDAEARALLVEGRQTRSPAVLRRIVDELFCSSVTDQALDMLGDLAFERGDFEGARHWWRLIAPLQPRERSLSFPLPKLETAIRAQAKQILALIFQGRLEEGHSAALEFAGRYSEAKGELAGQQDLYAKILIKTLTDFSHGRQFNNEEPWTTFGGDPTRNRILTQGLAPNLWEDGPAWRVKLPALLTERKREENILERVSASRRSAFHPVIIDNQVLIADHRSVVSHHLFTGKELFQFDLRSEGLADPGPGLDPKIPLPRFTLTVDHERAYIRLGRLGLGPNGNKKEAEREEASYLVCLDLTQPEVKKPRFLWHAKANTDGKTGTFFEGSPLVHEGHVYIALTKLSAQHSITSIVCRDLSGKERWSREVCKCPEFEGAHGPRYRQHLLSWADGQIIYCSHAGAIVAVDAWTGQPTWGVLYPSRGQRSADADTPRDLTACVAADGWVYVAPLDSDRLFCIDSITGRIRWELQGIEIVHLLGVARGQVLFATRTGVQAASATTGRALWAQPAEGRLPSLGRGIVSENWLFWPTLDSKFPYRAITVQSGQQQKDWNRSLSGTLVQEPELYYPPLLRQLPVGNMAMGQGCLAIAGIDELVVFVPPTRQPRGGPELRSEVRVDAIRQAQVGSRP
jgi:hypothetical protein